MFQYKNITVGSDPEFFIKNKKGKLISSIGIIEGTKHDPKKLPLLGDGFAIQTDNVLGEFNIPYATNSHEAMQNIAIMKAYIAGFLADKDLLPEYMASGVYTKDQLNSLEAKMFGCCPDYNVWTESVNESPEGAKTNLRSAGVHFHVGYDDQNETASLNIIKALDLFLGVPSVLIDPDTRRRELYGKAGCFRFTPFGIEYRSMSGFFISDNNLTEWCFNQVFKAIEYLNEFGIEKIQSYEEEIQYCINNGDKLTAEMLIGKFNLNIKY